MNILLVEPYPVIRWAIKKLLSTTFSNMAIYEATGPKEIGPLLACKMDLIILDVQTKEAPGFDLIKKVRKKQPMAPILIYSDYDEKVYGIHCLRAGASGFLSKRTCISQLQEAIKSVIENGRFVTPSIQTELLNQIDELNYRPDNPLLGLSAREITIMDMLLQGLWAKEIAAKLQLRESSISIYKAALFEKLNVNSLVEFHQRVEYFKQLT